MAKHGRYPYMIHCQCDQCVNARARQSAQARRGEGSRGGRHSNWSPAYGGSDADGNPVTVSFGSGKADRNTLLADGDQSEVNFFDSANHDHYGSGNGPNNNGTRRGKHTGRGS